MSNSLPVTFFCPEREELQRVNSNPQPVDETVEYWEIPQPARMRAWVVQTVLRLREAGYHVDISPELPEEGVLVLLPEPHILEAFLKQFGPEHRELLIVTIRADIEGFRSPLADAEIVQNGRFADEERVFHIPHWPQPGLTPRNPKRGTSIQTLAFKGDRGNLHPDLFSERLHSYLDRKGIDIRLEEAEDRTRPQPWHDFENIDLLVAVRKPWHDGDLFLEKPASKLINAWHAGVPALLGPEYAFRELREDPLDYIEVESDSDVIDAIEELSQHPEKYQAMVEHGRLRAQDFSVKRITERWAEVLFEKVPRLTDSPKRQIASHLPLPFRRAWNWIEMPPAPHEFKKQLGFLYRKVKRIGT